MLVVGHEFGENKRLPKEAGKEWVLVRVVRHYRTRWGLDFVLYLEKFNGHPVEINNYH